jgi:hypothetical protein
MAERGRREEGDRKETGRRQEAGQAKPSDNCIKREGQH